jgi:predicted amidohydrolase YtcJ
MSSSPGPATQPADGAVLGAAGRTLDDVRAHLAAERARCGPDTWVLGHSVRYEPFHASGIRADTVADVLGGGPALPRFFDGHTALATEPALALAGVAAAVLPTT